MVCVWEQDVLSGSYGAVCFRCSSHSGSREDVTALGSHGGVVTGQIIRPLLSLSVYLPVTYNLDLTKTLEQPPLFLML